ncbi:MAG: MATE family efflux transporter [Rhodospirillaceae bacterium]
MRDADPQGPGQIPTPTPNNTPEKTRENGEAALAADYSPSHLRAAVQEAPGLVKLAVPIFIALSAMGLIGVVDTLMIAPLGTAALAGAALTTAVLILFYCVIYGMLSACWVSFAQALGAKDFKGLNGALSSSLVLGVLLGVGSAVLMIALLPILPWMGQPPEVVAIVPPYWIAMAIMLIPFTLFFVMKGLFDALEKPWIGVAISYLAVLINVPFNYLLIHGIGSWDGLGLIGAGLASLLAMSVGFGAAWLYWRRAKTLASLRAEKASASRAEVVQQWRTGWPYAFGYLAEGGAYAFAGLMLGWFGAAALAAYQVVNAVASLFYMLPLGMASAVSLRVGVAVGAGENARLAPINTGALGTVTVWMVLVMVVLMLSGGWIASSLADDPEVVAIATSMFVIMAAMQVLDGIQSTSFGALRGILDTRFPAMVTTVSYWMVALPAAYVLGFMVGLGPNGVWLGYMVGLSLAGLALTLRYYRKVAQGVGAQGHDPEI